MAWCEEELTICNYHSNQNPHPGICPSCLREKLKTLTISSSLVFEYYYSSSSSSTGCVSPRQRGHQRVVSDVLGSNYFNINGSCHELTKSRSVAFAPRNKGVVNYDMDQWPSDFGGRQNKRPDKGKAKLNVDLNREASPNQIWLPANVMFLIDEMYKLWQQGVLLSNNFGTSQFQSLAITMQVSAPIRSHIPWTVKQLQTKARNLRCDWRKYHDLLTRQTGWGINPDTGFIEAPEGAWEAYCDAHPTFDKELIHKPFLRYQQCTDMWAPTTATGRYARLARGIETVELDDDDSPNPTRRGSLTNSSGKRASRDWRDDDATGTATKKTAVAESIQKSLDAWSQLSEARMKRYDDDKEKVEIDELNDAVFSFEDEVGLGPCIRAMDMLMGRREMAYAWLKWKRAAQLYWIKEYAS